MPYRTSKRPKFMEVATGDSLDENEGILCGSPFNADDIGLTRASASIQTLPTETITHIFGYLTSQATEKDIRKDNLYHAALTCRRFSQIAIPMLWHEFHFMLSDNAPKKEPYQDSFLAILDGEMHNNFIHTKKLGFNITMRSELVTNERNAMRIRRRLEQFLAIYKSAAPGLKSLNLVLQPFIPTDCINEELWSSANGCNDLIYNLVAEVVHRESPLEKLRVNVGNGAWAYDVEFRPHLYQLLYLLAPKITSLELAEQTDAILPFLPAMKSLTEFEFDAIGEHDEEQATAIWQALSRLPLVEVGFSQLNVPLEFHRFAPQSLTKLCMNGVDDIVSACMVCLTRLPNLEWCCLNNGKLKPRKTPPDELPLTEIVCTKLIQVCFLNSLVPAGIISVIAKQNHNLRMCLAPPNVTDHDIHMLSLNCPLLQTFLMSNAKCIPTCMVSRSGLCDLTRLGRLQTLCLHTDLLPVIDMALLSSFAENNSILAKLEIWFPEDGGKRCSPLDVNELLTGEEYFKEMFVELLGDNKCRDPIWIIKGADLRAKLC
jgi:F-box-like